MRSPSNTISIFLKLYQFSNYFPVVSNKFARLRIVGKGEQAWDSLGLVNITEHMTH